MAKQTTAGNLEVTGDLIATGDASANNLSGTNTGDEALVNGTAVGQIAFWDGTNWTFTETSEMFWDDTNKRLGIGTGAPSSIFSVTKLSTDILSTVLASNSSPTVGELYIRNTVLNTVDSYAGIAFSPGQTTTGAGINFARIGAVREAEKATALVFLNRAAKGTSNLERMRITSTGNVGIGTASPTAVLQLKAGTATANTAPLKFTSGVLNTTAEAGAMEFVTDDITFVITTGTARKGIVLDDGTRLTATRVPFATTNGRLTDDADMTFATDTLTVTKIVGTTSIKVGTAGGFISSDNSTGATGSFTTVDLKTVTVKDGIITSIV